MGEHGGPAPYLDARPVSLLQEGHPAASGGGDEGVTFFGVVARVGVNKPGGVPYSACRGEGSQGRLVFGNEIANREGTTKLSPRGPRDARSSQKSPYGTGGAYGGEPQLGKQIVEWATEATPGSGGPPG